MGTENYRAGEISNQERAGGEIAPSYSILPAIGARRALLSAATCLL